MNKTLKILLWLAGAIVVLFVAAAVAAVILFPAERIRGIAEDTLTDAAGMTVTIDELGLSFWGMPSISVRGVHVGDPLEGEGRLLEIPSAGVRVDILSLLRRRVEIVSVNVDDPALTLVAREDGTSNLPEPAEKDTTAATGPPSLPIPVSLHRFSLDNGTVVIDNSPADGPVITCTGVSVDLGMDMDASLTNIIVDGESAIGDIALSAGADTPPISGISLRADHRITGDAVTGTFTLDDGNLRVNDLPFELRGGMREWETLEFGARATGLSITGILDAVPPGLIPQREDITAEGTVDFTVDGSLDIADPDAEPVFAGSFTADVPLFSYAGLPNRVESTALRVSFSERTVTLEEFATRIGASSVSATGTVFDYATTPVISFETQGTVNLDDVTGAFPMPGEIEADGLITFAVGLDGDPADIASFEADGSADFNNLHIMMPETFNHPATLDGAVSVAPNAVTVERFDFASGESSLHFTGALSNYFSLAGLGDDRAFFRGSLTSPGLDITGLLVAGDMEDTRMVKPWDMEESLTNLPIPPILDADLTVRTGPVRFGRLVSDSVEGRLALTGGVFELTGAAVEAYDGTMSGTARLTLADPDSITYAGDFTLDSFQSGTFISDFFGTEEFMRGALSGTVAFSGAGLDSLSFVRNLAGRGSMTFADGEIDNWEFTRRLGDTVSFLDFDTLEFSSITNTFRIEDQRVITPDMAVNASFGDIRMDGWTAFDTSLDYTLTLLLDEQASERAAERLTALSRLFSGDTGRLEFVVEADGTLASPSFSLDTSRAEQRLRELAEEQVKSRAEEYLDTQGGELKEKGKELLDNLFGQ